MRNGETDRIYEEAREKVALEVAREERNSKVFGMGIIAIGALTITVPILLHGTITAIPALAGVAIMVVGGLVRDKDTFIGIATSLIDALPGGKN